MNIFSVKYMYSNDKNIENILYDNIIIHKDLYQENIKYKNLLNNVPYHHWKIIRSILHDYEIIGNNRIHEIDIFKNYDIISRAYYKLLEILNTFEKTLKIKKKETMNISCLCEAPGGFIQCLRDYRKNDNDKYISISKKDDEQNKIDWKINFNNLKIIYGDNEDNDGNLYNPKIIEYYINSHKEKVDLVTADGGLLLNGYEENYKSNFHIKLYLCELYIALKILKDDGVFILKIYEMSQKIMIDFLILLNTLFLNVKIIKPKTSRQMNNEKYVICYNKKSSKQIEKKLFEIINKLWLNKNLLIKNLLNKDYFQKNNYLLKIFEEIELRNLIKQNKKLKESIDLKDCTKEELKYNLKNKKNIHLKCAYKWVSNNSIK